MVVFFAEQKCYDPNGNQLAQMTNTVGASAGKTGGISIGGPADPQSPPFELRKYDGRNRLTSYYAPGQQATYTYQANGLRLAKTVNGVSTTHIWDGQNIAADLDANNTINI